MIDGTELQRAHRDLLSGPAQRQFAGYFGDHAVAAWVAEQDQVIIRDVTQRNGAIVFDTWISTKPLRKFRGKAVECFPAVRLNRRTPGVARRPYAEERA